MIAEPNQDVTLGGLSLMAAGQDVPYADGYVLRVTGDDATLGSSQAVTSVLFSMLSDGSIVQRDRDDNRQPVLIIEVEADHEDGRALALGEAALQSVCDKRVELVWRPPQPGAPVAVFDIVDSKLDPIYSDMDEVSMRRGYRLTMTALPWGRSEDETVSLAETPGVTTFTTVDNADATTGWTSIEGVISDVGTAIRAFRAGVLPGGFVPPTSSLSAEVTGFSSTVLDTRRYVVVEWRTTFLPVGAGLTLDNHVTDLWSGYVHAAKIAEFAKDADWRQTWFALTSPVQTDRLKFMLGPLPTDVDYELDIRDVSATPTLPAIGSRRQLVRNLAVGGSVTTQGSIIIEHETTDLGEVILYTRQNKPSEPYVPPLSPYRIAAGHVVTDAARVSGGYQDVSANIGFYVIPVTAIPEGEYHVAVRVYVATGTVASFSIQWREFYSSTGLIDLDPSGFASYVTRNYAITVPNATWVTLVLDPINLPTVAMRPGATVEIQVTEPAGTLGLRLDEMWLFKTDGKLTMTDPLTRQRLRVDAPSLDEPSGAIWLGDDPTWLYGFSAAMVCRSRQHHDLEPGDNMVLSVTTGVADAAVSARHHDRWNTYPSH